MKINFHQKKLFNIRKVLNFGKVFFTPLQGI